MGPKKRCSKRRRRRRRPLYKCMVKTAMAYLKQRPRATREQIERKVVSIYKKRGLDHSKHQKSIGRAIRGLMKTRCIKKHGSRYQIISTCARDALSVHKRRRSRSCSRTLRSQSRSHSHSKSGSKSTSRSRDKSRSISHSHSKSRSRSGSGGSSRRHTQHIRRRGSRHKTTMSRHLKSRQSQGNNVHCPPNPPPSNPVSKFPFRDAMIIAMTIFVSYWMQRTASQMRFPSPNSFG